MPCCEKLWPRARPRENPEPPRTTRAPPRAKGRPLAPAFWRQFARARASTCAPARRVKDARCSSPCLLVSEAPQSTIQGHQRAGSLGSVHLGLSRIWPRQQRPTCGMSAVSVTSGSLSPSSACTRQVRPSSANRAGGGWPPRALFCPGSATGPVQVRLMSVNAWFQITLKPRLAAPPHDGMEPKHPVFGGAVNRRIRGVRARRCVAASR